MREIVFRGKRLDNGQWIYGDLRQFSGRSWGIHDRESRRTFRVDPATVGEFTGVADKNGVKVFEGDIISIPFPILFEEDRDPWEPNCTCYLNAEVFFSEEYHGWCVRFLDGYDDEWLWEYDEYEHEVIGNIYDNPELVSGADQCTEQH